GNETQPQEDQRVRRAIAHARDGALACHRLRQSVENRALRDGQRPDAQGGRAETWIRDGGRIRSRRRSEEDGSSVRRDRSNVDLCSPRNPDSKGERSSWQPAQNVELKSCGTPP